MQAAPLWDPSLCQFVGLLTVTDFIDILRHYRSNGLEVTSLATRSIAEILHQVKMTSTSNNKSTGLSPFLSADTTTTLKQACRILHDHSLDFLPVLYPEDMRVLATITYTNILEHLVTHFREQRRLFDDTIYELGIGTYHDNVQVGYAHQTLAEALDILAEHSLGALPVVMSTEDGDGGNGGSHKLLGVYSRSDITFLASASDAEDAISNLKLTLGEVLAQQRTDVATTPDALHTCTKQHTLQSIFEYFAQLRFNRLYVVEHQNQQEEGGSTATTDNSSPPILVGVVSARDLVAYFLE